MLNKIFSIKNEDNHKILTILGIKFKFKIAQKDLTFEIPQTTIDKIVKKINRQAIERANRITPKPYLTNFVVDITRHCNLNCRGCDHFSPVAKPSFYDLEQYKNDIKRIGELTQGRVDKVGIMGGEPLLNPNVLEYLKLTRESLPNTKIRLVTNGILLTKQNEEFWKTLKELNIFVEYTKYDIKLDYDKIDEIIKQYAVNIEVYGYNQNVVKTSHKIPLDLRGNQNVVCNFMNCFHANHCISLKNGRLYTCTVAPNIDNFNQYFNKNIPLTEYDGIDIYKAQNIQEVLEFLARPIPFCKYCFVNKRTFGHEFGISKKDISEWTVE